MLSYERAGDLLLWKVTSGGKLGRCHLVSRNPYICVERDAGAAQSMSSGRFDGLDRRIEDATGDPEPREPWTGWVDWQCRRCGVTE